MSLERQILISAIVLAVVSHGMHMMGSAVTPFATGIALFLFGVSFLVVDFLPYSGSLTALVLSLGVAPIQGWSSLGPFVMALAVVALGHFLESISWRRDWSANRLDFSVFANLVGLAFAARRLRELRS
ncbi:MAG: hypothetical protein JO288_18865 [Hyphomicrobiales bacterium]|nr:hypothetical protein [Hyphomicrobiales bacterium]